MEDWEDFLRENVRYDLETGYIFWSKQNEKGNLRNLSKPMRGSPWDGERYVGFSDKSKKRTFLYPRLCWFLYYGDWPEGCLCHINGDDSDNRMDNLELKYHK
jgi:hypothetical protein